jgi:DNA-binding winged helix-turn-helix (wHTH) protein
LIYDFDGCELDLDRYELRRDGAVEPVEPQVFDVLTVLVRERGRVVRKDELLDLVWGSRYVSESALTSRVKAARRAIGDDGRAQRLIRTVHGRGYQFVATVTERPASQPEPGAGPGLSLPTQQIRFCPARDGTRLAYATIGSGPPLVKVANWLSHLDYDWENQVWQHWLVELSRRPVGHPGVLLMAGQRQRLRRPGRDARVPPRASFESVQSHSVSASARRLSASASACPTGVPSSESRVFSSRSSSSLVASAAMPAAVGSDCAPELVIAISHNHLCPYPAHPALAALKRHRPGLAVTTIPVDPARRVPGNRVVRCCPPGTRAAAPIGG